MEEKTPAFPTWGELIKAYTQFIRVSKDQKIHVWSDHMELSSKVNLDSSFYEVWPQSYNQSYNLGLRCHQKKDTPRY